nr:MAG: hypothetical protein [Gammatorquevirus sp.]
MSPESLRRKYLPRNTRAANTQAAHHRAAAVSVQPQVQPPKSIVRNESQTKTTTTTNGTIQLTKFKPGFEQQTEWELSCAFLRPPRTYKEDTPFYPWLPNPVPRVNFHLNYKF